MQHHLIRTLVLVAPCLLLGAAFAPALSHAQPDDTRLPLGNRPKPSAPSVGAGEFAVSIEGAKQGRFKGEGASEASKDKIVGVGFNYEIKSPHDASGASMGKRQHQPIVFTKEWGAASPQLFQAATTNESLKTVLFEFHQSGTGRAVEVFYTIKLSNASITSIRQYEDHGKFLEDVSLTFGKIEVEHRGSKTTASDETSK